MTATATKDKPVRVIEGEETSLMSAARHTRPRTIALMGQLDENQGRLTYSGRLTLDQFCDLTIVHNRKWADDAGEGFEQVTQREIIEKHVNGLATFFLQGLVSTTLGKAEEEKLAAGVVDALKRIQSRVGETAHYGIPQVTLVLEGEPTVRMIKDDDGAPVAAKLLLPAGKLFVVADGQHRREAAKRVRDFLYYVVGNRSTPKNTKLYGQDAPLTADEVEAWIAVQGTFQSSSVIAYEAHLGITVPEARQLFTNINSHVKPVDATLSYQFDQSNPINQFAKGWLAKLLKRNGAADYDLRELATINGFLFLGKPSIRFVPFDVGNTMRSAKEFWDTIVNTKEWKRKGSAIHEVAVLKGLAKAWFMVYTARRNSQAGKEEQLNEYLKTTRFDDAWVGTMHGMRQMVIASADTDGAWRFVPTHNHIVALIVKKALR